MHHPSLFLADLAPGPGEHPFLNDRDPVHEAVAAVPSASRRRLLEGEWREDAALVAAPRPAGLRGLLLHRPGRPQSHQGDSGYHRRAEPLEEPQSGPAWAVQIDGEPGTSSDRYPNPVLIDEVLTVVFQFNGTIGIKLLATGWK